MIRIGMVGCGFIGAQHFWGIRSLGRSGLLDVAVTRVYDRDPERAASFAPSDEVEVCSSLDDLLDSVDAVWVCSWTAGHLEAVKAAAERGLPLFCEKPLARTLDECVALAQAARKVPHQVGMLLRHSPALQTTREIVRSGRYGRVMGTVLRDDQDFPVGGIYGSAWRADVEAAGGGTLIEHSIHDVDLLAWFFGAPDRVSARTANFSGHPGVEDFGAVTLSHTSGATSVVFSVWHQIEARDSSRRLEIFCEQALVWLDNELGPVHVETSSGHEQIQGEIPAFVSRLDLDGVPDEWKMMAAAFAVEDKPFLEELALRGSGARGQPDVEDALLAHRIVDAAYRSAAQGGVPQEI